MTNVKNRLKTINLIKKKTGNAPDVTYKDYPLKNKTITLIYSNSVSSQTDINDFILRRLDEDKDKIKDDEIFNYIKNYIPNNTYQEITTIEDTLYYLFN